MTASSKTIRITALNTLKGNWIKAIAAVCVLIFSFCICNLLSSVIFQIAGLVTAKALVCSLEIFLLAPLCLGVIRYFWRMLFGIADNPISVFYYYSNKQLYYRALKLTLYIGVRLFLIWALLSLPSFVLWLVTDSFIYDIFNISIPVWSANLEETRILLSVIADVILCFFALKYYLAPVLVAADENMDCIEAIKMSVVISKKTALDFVYLFFSSWLWILLSFLIMPLLITLPYLITAYAAHIKFAVADFNFHINAINQSREESFSVGG